jgi:cold shock CspA family protein
MEKKTGTVIFFLPVKNYGYIQFDDEDGDIYFHQSSLMETSSLEANDHVSFNVSKRCNKPYAINVRKIT